MDIWFGNPEYEVTSEETGDEIILKKDVNGKTIGIEKLNFIPAGSEEVMEIPMKVVIQQITLMGEIINSMLHTPYKSMYLASLRYVQIYL